MTIAFVQEVASGGTPSNSLTLVLTLGAVTTTVGNHLFLAIASRGGLITGIVDSKGNTWQGDHASTGASEVQEIWSCKLTSALVAADTITVTSDQNTGHAAVVAEFSGLASSSWLDKQVGATNAANGTSADSGATGTTSQADELLIGVVGHMSGISAFTPEVLSPVWNQLSAPASVGVVQQAHPMHRIVSATGTYSTKATWVSSRPAGAAIATYKAAPPLPGVASVTDTSPAIALTDAAPTVTLIDAAATVTVSDA